MLLETKQLQQMAGCERASASQDEEVPLASRRPVRCKTVGRLSITNRFSGHIIYEVPAQPLPQVPEGGDLFVGSKSSTLNGLSMFFFHGFRWILVFLRSTNDSGSNREVRCPAGLGLASSGKHLCPLEGAAAAFSCLA